MADGLVMASGPRIGVLADAWGGSLAREVALVVGGAAVVGAAAQVSVTIPGSPVPVTGQTFAVLLAGTALGSARGVASMLFYVVAGVLGVPWFADGAHGWPAATMGYLLGFVLAAAVVGRLAAVGADRRPGRMFGLMVLGNLVIYAVGVPWLMVATGVDVPAALLLGLVPFLAGDLLKALLAAGLLPGSWRLVRRLSSSA
ncbi:biotin transporter BioY [Salinispora oceanensis]|uniref:biotin transporter BioY n=1 Tax=Salinispora oceanensis TaxID=1050199 RepID=UPI0003721848|nr:biotin transporter BioY [Salinispora oceanensis]